MEQFRPMNERTSEQELIEASRDGDDGAFEELFRRNQRRVFSIALNFFGGNKQTAEDITQQAFIKLYRGLDLFRGDAKVSTWLYRVTINLCIDEQKRGSRFRFIRDLFGPEGSEPEEAGDDTAARMEISDEVRKAVSEIKPEFRVPIVLKHVEGLSYSEMAEILEVPEGTIASRLSRGHKILARRLEHLRSER